MNEEFLQALTALLVQNPTWNRTNTPPDLLAQHMISSLSLFETTLIARQMYYSRPTGIEAYQYELPEATS